MAYRRKNIQEREQHQQRGQRHRRNEWYSPQDVVDRARRVMGAIDLDPASCVQANEIVRAVKYYDQSADGLSRPWRGRVWLNPPYDTFAPKFFTKFCEEYEAGQIPMAILLLGVHHLTTLWFQRAGAFSAMLSLPARRLKFTSSLAKGNPPMHGSAILGVGVNPDLFRREFGEIGIILELQARQQAAAVPSPPLVLVSNRG
jgi:ParB family chromosome partitioning protein